MNKFDFNIFGYQEISKNLNFTEKYILLELFNISIYTEKPILKNSNVFRSLINDKECKKFINKILDDFFYFCDDGYYVSKKTFESIVMKTSGAVKFKNKYYKNLSEEIETKVQKNLTLKPSSIEKAKKLCVEKSIPSISQLFEKLIEESINE